MRAADKGSRFGRFAVAGPLAKSIVFILVTGAATALLALTIANSGVSGSTGYNAVFTDATGLGKGDGVRIAGVPVGQVDSVTIVDRRYARVHFSLQSGRTLPASVTAGIKYLNLVGQRYVELDQGTGPVGRTMPAGGTIPVDRTQPALDLTQLFNGFQPLFTALSPKDTDQLAGEIVQVLQGEGGTMDQLVSTVGSLTSTLAGKDRVIGQVIDNLTGVVDTVDAHQTGLKDLVATLQQLVSGFSADRQPLGAAIGSLSSLTTTTAGLLQQGRAPLHGDIVQLKRLVDDLTSPGPLPLLEDFLKNTPVKLNEIGRLASYGSWLNLYMCQARVSGVGVTDDRMPDPTGIGITAARCG